MGTSRLGERPGVQDRSRGEREDEYDFEFAAKAMRHHRYSRRLVQHLDRQHHPRFVMSRDMAGKLEITEINGLVKNDID